MKLFVKNSLSGVVQLILTACLTFYSIPLFINHLGAETYGIYAIVGVIGNLNVIVNLGLNTSLLRFLGAQGKCKESDHDIIATVILLLIILLPVSFLAIHFRTIILMNILGLNPYLAKQGEVLYIGVLTANFLIIIGQTFTTLLDVQQRTYLVNTFQFIYSLSYWLGNIVLVHLGYGLNEVGYCIVISACIWLVITIIAALKYWGKLNLTELNVSIRYSILKQIKYGGNVYSAGLLSFLYEPLTKLILSRLFGVSAAGYYDIASRIKGQVYSLASRALYPIYPWMTKQSSKITITSVIKQVQQKALFLLIPICILIYFCIPSIIEYALHKPNREITWTVIGLLTSYLIFSVPVIPTYHYLIAKGLAKHTTIVQFINVTLNIIVIFLLQPWINFYSVIFGHLAAQIGSFAYLQYCQRKNLGSYILSQEETVKLMCLMLLLITFITITHYLWDDSVSSLIVLPMLTAVVSIYYYRWVGIFKNEELEQLLGKKTLFGSFARLLLVR